MVTEHYQSSQEDYVIYLMHMAAYRFAESFTSGKRVLDYGCGSGYGATSVVETALHVCGVDVADDAIAYARERFCRPNLTFQQIDIGRRLPFGDEEFDVVLSFQVLEHVDDTDQYLSEARRVLAPGGYLLLVTPDRMTRLFPMQRPWNRWHVREYSGPTLATTIRRHFQQVDVQHMSGPPALVGVELRRYRKVRWLTLPATVPLFPDRIRVMLLNAIHAVRPKAKPPSAPLEFHYDVSAVTIAPDASPSLNLVAVAQA
jgi:SAM-dependent methyltransferase